MSSSVIPFSLPLPSFGPKLGGPKVRLVFEKVKCKEVLFVYVLDHGATEMEGGEGI